MNVTTSIRPSLLFKVPTRLIHACARREAKEVASKGKGKQNPSTLFAPISKPINPIQPTQAPSSSPSSSSSTNHITNHSRSKQWKDFENSWPYQPLNTRSKDKIIEIRTIFEKPINFNPFFKLFGCAFAAFIGFQWFWLPDNSGEYQTLWKYENGTGYGTRVWGTIKHILYVQTPFWALGGAAFGIWRLTKTLNIVTKLDQCRIIPSNANGKEEIYLRMNTVKQTLLRGLSKEPRDLRLESLRVIPISGPHQKEGDMILSIHVNDAKARRFSDGQPYIVDTRYSRFLDKTDKPFVLSPSRLRHVFGKFEGQ
ncbi:uncharacterized protein I206_103545 [Kwoniella pini CBS 10737]|uniref:Uncharacterized protein n=1 Tax=Kwoniella pini CBS 10737 TaxID=1296096 RepID=A0A1B9I9E5_9TREE|nr:uncharacterized protein I206_01451 [Kwoniella pini CBS 10737]OCF52166.1 hypothetical protein I206_01451 [Kwoniella pini CBS 10737]